MNRLPLVVAVATVALVACVDSRSDDGAGGTDGAGAGTTSNNGSGAGNASVGGMGVGGVVPNSSVVGPGGGPNCVQQDGEPNDTEGDAEPLSSVDDCDGPMTIPGTMQGDQDIDWFTYYGTDDICNVSPRVTLLMGDPGTELCMYFFCGNGLNSLTCPNNTTTVMSPELALEGCCGAAPTLQVPGLDCSGASEDADVYISVRANIGPACVHYELETEY